MNGREWLNISDQAKEFIALLFTFEHADRPSAATALKHPWLTELASPQVENQSVEHALANMRRFQADQPLKKVAYSFVVSQLLTMDEIELPTKVFKAIDKDGDGQLSEKEVLNAFQKHCTAAVSNGEVDTIFTRMNLSNSGLIQFSEFLMASMDFETLFTTERCEAIFKMIAK